MGASSGFALKGLLWVTRFIQFCCSIVVLGIWSYFLAVLNNHDLLITVTERAVTGLSALAGLYTLCGLLLLCCVAGFTIAAIAAIILDIGFVGIFIYIAYSNRHGAGSCSNYVTTPFGIGFGPDEVDAPDGFTALPTFRTACRLQKACLAVSIIAIFFFLFSIVMEVVLGRHHRKEKRFGPGPTNNYTSGYGSPSRGGFLSRFRRNKTAPADDGNNLPEHTHPAQLSTARQAEAPVEATAASHDAPVASTDRTKQEAGYGYQAGTAQQAAPAAANQPPGTYRYTDGAYEQA